MIDISLKLFHIESLWNLKIKDSCEILIDLLCKSHICTIKEPGVNKKLLKEDIGSLILNGLVLIEMFELQIVDFFVCKKEKMRTFWKRDKEYLKSIIKKFEDEIPKFQNISNDDKEKYEDHREESSSEKINLLKDDDKKVKNICPGDKMKENQAKQEFSCILEKILTKVNIIKTKYEKWENDFNNQDYSKDDNFLKDTFDDCSKLKENYCNDVLKMQNLESISEICKINLKEIIEKNLKGKVKESGIIDAFFYTNRLKEFVKYC